MAFTEKNRAGRIGTLEQILVPEPGSGVQRLQITGWIRNVSATQADIELRFN